MTEIKLTKRYPNSRIEDITDAYMRGWNDALDAVQNGKFHIAEQTEPICENCKWAEVEWADEPCENCCKNNSGFEPKHTEPTASKTEMVEQTEPSTERPYDNAWDMYVDEFDDYKPSTDCGWK